MSAQFLHPTFKRIRSDYHRISGPRKRGRCFVPMWCTRVIRRGISSSRELFNTQTERYVPMWCTQVIRRGIATSQALCKAQAGRYKVTKNRSRPLTYEQANPPHQIAHRKAWNSWNTSGLRDGLRASETATEDIFIRKFMEGTWHKLFISQILIKRRYNAIYIGGIVQRTIMPRKIYFLIGYTEEILSYILKCPIKVEVQTVSDAKDIIYKYI